jgi:hypothetical protein
VRDMIAIWVIALAAAFATHARTVKPASVVGPSFSLLRPFA